MSRGCALLVFAAALVLSTSAWAQFGGHHPDHSHDFPEPVVPRNLPGGLTLEFEKAVREGLPSPEEAALGAARQFFATLLQSGALTIARGSQLPFMMEDRRITDREELEAEWQRQMRGKRLDLHVLYGIEVFTPEQMEKKYGPPPARLKALPWKGKDVWIAVANLSGRPTIALFKQVAPEEFLLTGFHD